MATIRKEIAINRNEAQIWYAIRDVGAIHQRLVRGFVTDCRLEGDTRTVTFANGMVVREVILSLHDETYRNAWSAQAEALTHYNASVQVFAMSECECHVLWLADLLPHEAATPIG